MVHVGRIAAQDAPHLGPRPRCAPWAPTAYLNRPTGALLLESGSFIRVQWVFSLAHQLWAAAAKAKNVGDAKSPPNPKRARAAFATLDP